MVKFYKNNKLELDAWENMRVIERDKYETKKLKDQQKKNEHKEKNNLITVLFVLFNNNYLNIDFDID